MRCALLQYILLDIYDGTNPRDERTNDYMRACDFFKKMHSMEHKS